MSRDPSFCEPCLNNSSPKDAQIVGGYTPTPWHFSDDGWEIYSEPSYQSVAQLLAVPEVEANADFIVRAVNSHDALVKALHKAAGVLSGEDTNKRALIDALEAIKAALASLASSREVRS